MIYQYYNLFVDSIKCGTSPNRPVTLYEMGLGKFEVIDMSI